MRMLEAHQNSAKGYGGGKECCELRDDTVDASKATSCCFSIDRNIGGFAWGDTKGFA